MNQKYSEILYERYQGSKNHRKMANSARAAQFMPFAALTGYDDSIHEASRLTTQKKELTEQEKETLDYKLKSILEKNQHPKIQITYFEKDDTKSGGEYITEELEIKKIDMVEHKIYFKNHTSILIEDVIEVSL